ncbi:sugar ABC transporter ATP-binding protein [Mesorhizobium sp.]|uniref:sugar ABC transporter ATP-binding protein n=1 Tax=Mesorhizobium sp. TaxID=1871066 RepID=UPI0025BFD085|nr:sugar ABC transporter ATP-binding protein [Mesorhizobium sp.]
MDGAVPLFRMEGISKRYGGVRALEKAELSVTSGSIHAILGENGAGKSTLIKVMAGVVAPDEGRMMLDGSEVTFASPAAANQAGIVCIFQELSLVPELSVADNIVISDPPKRFGMIDRRAQRRIAEDALARAGAADIHPLALVKDLPLSRRQIVEIAKALARKPRILILDEATSALTAADVAKIFGVLKRLRSEGLALLYISHRMNEIAELADQCTVFRNGRNVASYAAGTKSDNEVVELMIGREYSHIFPPKPVRAPATAAPVLEARKLSWTDRLDNISLSVGAGEVVGLGGLDGQGQRELLLAFFGVLRGLSGQILIDGRPATIASPAAARDDRIGMALIPEDRKTEGLMLPMTVRENLSFAALDRLSRAGIIDRAAEQRLIDDMVGLLAIKTAGLDIPVGALSGGNQQKVVIAKWLMRQPRIILLNDPTRGIDVGTKQELYQLMRKLADQGAAILFYSTDYDELIGCCDRVLVLYDGAVKRELVGAEITERALIASALNIHGEEMPVRGMAKTPARGMAKTPARGMAKTPARGADE